MRSGKDLVLLVRLDGGREFPLGRHRCLDFLGRVVSRHDDLLYVGISKPGQLSPELPPPVLLLRLPLHQEFENFRLQIGAAEGFVV